MWERFGHGEWFPLSCNFMNENDGTSYAADQVPELEGFWDFKAHCDGYFFSDTEEFINEYSPEEVARYIETNTDWDGVSAIRCLACSAGRFPDGAARQLNFLLGVPVLAPILDLWINKDTGELTVLDEDPSDLNLCELSLLLLQPQQQEKLWRLFE